MPCTARLFNRHAYFAQFRLGFYPDLRMNSIGPKRQQQNVYVKVIEKDSSSGGIFLLDFGGFMIYSGVKGRRANAFEMTGLTEGSRSQAEAF